jgi:endonuclease YncB( thermonuclease family)
MAAVNLLLKKMAVFSAVALLVIVVGSRFFYRTMVAKTSQSENLFVVSKILDAETLQLENGAQVRMIGLRVPRTGDPKPKGTEEDRAWENVRFVGKNSAAARSFLIDRSKGKTVHLQYDPVYAGVKHRDPRGRILAYVWLRELELSIEQNWLVADLARHPYGFPVLLNACMIRAGFARTDESVDFDYVREFRVLQGEALQDGRGIWAKPEMSRIRDGL